MKDFLCKKLDTCPQVMHSLYTGLTLTVYGCMLHDDHRGKGRTRVRFLFGNFCCSVNGLKADNECCSQPNICFDTTAKLDKHGAGCILASEGATAISNMPQTWTCTGDASSTTCTATSSQLFINGFSYGEAMISLLLLLILTALIFHTFWARIFGIKLSVPFYRTFLGNNSKEGKEIKNI